MVIRLPPGCRSIHLRATRNIGGIAPYQSFNSHQKRAASTKCRSKKLVEDAVRSLETLECGEHYDTATYAAYAQRTLLDTSSTTYVGTHYEYQVASTLKRLGFDLKRVGGRGDFGIDLIGAWVVPSSPNPLRVIIQCKAAGTKTMLGPRLIRELEGAFIGAPPGWRGEGVIGLLVAQKPATKGVRDSLGRSRWPMGFISCLPDGTVQQMLWNRRAEDEGLAGLGVGIRFSESDPNAQELILTLQGKPSMP
ncbi:hypothetical protein PG994_013110 [Apiospora phragmitis]|uniref:Restriction endonuclease type IV Mrr domain-containing protein n=1 Tax=Apiospora phragmitis TaxID=2905665 RepID=A0ABR1T7Q5_9PEZI